MKTNNFEAFSKTSAGRCSATLAKRFSTLPPNQLWNAVYSAATMLVPQLMEGSKNTTEQLCGPDIWLPWLTVERRIAGMCMAYMVKVRVVPLTLHLTPSGKGKKRYCPFSMKAGVATLPTDVIPEATPWEASHHQHQENCRKHQS